MEERAMESSKASGLPNKSGSDHRKSLVCNFQYHQKFRTSGGLSDWFQTVVGVLQSCILSPLLFNIFLEVVMAKALEYVNDGITICGYTLNNLCFADDIAAVSDSQQGLQSVVGRIANTSYRMGMCISTEKTEVQHIDRHPNLMTITINQQKLKQTDKFIYFGKVINSDGTAERDIQRRIGLACDGMNRLATIWISKELSTETKVLVYNYMVIGILIYNSETLTLSERLKNKLQAFEMSCLRKYLGVSRIYHIRNTDIKNQLNIQHDIVDTIRSRRLRYFGHVVRMQPSRWPHRALYGHVHGNRHRGRLRKHWTDNISDDCQMMGLSFTQATHERERENVYLSQTHSHSYNKERKKNHETGSQIRQCPSRGWGQKTMEGIHEADRACLIASPRHRRRRRNKSLGSLFYVFTKFFFTKCWSHCMHF